MNEAATTSRQDVLRMERRFDAPPEAVFEYVEVRRPDRLRYTWAWETEAGEPAPGEPSLVSVDFLADGDGTRVELTHEGLSSEESRAQHAHGWNACLDNLARRVLG